jgi:hypothetical protein
MPYLKTPTIPIHSIYGNPQKRPNCVFSEILQVTIGNYQTLFINNGIIMGTIQPSLGISSHPTMAPCASRTLALSLGKSIDQSQKSNVFDR